MENITLETIKQTRLYLDYLEDHVRRVEAAWELVQKKCKDMRFVYDDFYYHSINEAVKTHDLSKLSEKEFVQYRRKFYPTKTEKEQDVDNVSTIDYEFKKALEHHKEKNIHHWECINPDLIHSEINYALMAIDWIAMSKDDNLNAIDFYHKHKEEMKLKSWAETFICDIFNRVYAK